MRPFYHVHESCENSFTAKHLQECGRTSLYKTINHYLRTNFVRTHVIQIKSRYIGNTNINVLTFQKGKFPRQHHL